MEKLPTPPPDSSDAGDIRGDRLQIINDAKEFSPHLRQFMDTTWGLSHSGFDYNVVAVFGSQSTGKSTLLNRLFKTRFDVMNDSSRAQTTKGVWLSRAAEHPILVMDVEGTDGRERGEDQEFERRSALFSMAVAEVIIINIWENMVGLYNGANMGLLKTVFEVNLQLFHSSQSKTLLFFVIRDHVGVTPLANLENVTRESLAKIWKELAKPEGLESSQMTDFFDFKFAALPHKILQPEKFESEVDLLRDRCFVDKAHADYVFAKAYHKQIPADGFPHYTQTIWEKIIGSKDLDLPTQQQLLAQYRCDEIMAEVIGVFNTDIQPAIISIDIGRVLEEFHILGLSRKNAIDDFSKEASRYHQEFYQKKKQELLERLNAKLNILFMGQLKNARRQAVADFKVQVTNILSGSRDDFAEQLVKAQQKSEEFFFDKAVDAKLSDTQWSFDEDVAALHEELQNLSSKMRIEEMDKLMKRLQKASQRRIIDGVSEQFADSPVDMWSRILKEYSLTVSGTVAGFKTKIEGFQPAEEEINACVEALTTSLWESLKSKIDEEVSDQLLQVRLRRRFEDCFRYTEDGLPRVWQEKDNIEECFIKAKDDAEALIPLFAKIPLSDEFIDDNVKNDSGYEEDASAIQLLSQAKQRDLKDRLKRDADLIFMEVKRGAVHSFAEIPRAMWVLLFALGFNEVYAALSFLLLNPIMLVLTSVLGVVGGVMYQSGMLMPAIRVAMSSAEPAARVAMASAAPILAGAGDAIASGLKVASQRIEERSRNSNTPQPVEMQSTPKRNPKSE